MIGKTILHFTPWDNRIGIIFVQTANALKKLIFAFNKILSNGVNKIIEKLGEARLLMTCIGESWEILNG